jgi:hypothetical protein
VRILRIREIFEAEEGAAALLLCAVCKQPVRSGEQHQCNKEKDNEDKEKEESN